MRLILKILTTLSLVLTLSLTGLMICIHVPAVTHLLSLATSHNELFGVDSDTMAQAALFTRDFSIGSIDRESLMSSLAQLGIDGNLLDDEMLNHLSDCTWVFALMTNIFLGTALATLIFAILTLVVSGRGALGKVFVLGGCLTIALLVIFVFALCFGFEEFFTWMHSLFFEGQSWLFDAQSLLISLFPTAFWEQMGVVWVAGTLVATLAVIVIGVAIHGKKPVLE